MWEPSIIGFGEYHYKYDSGHEGDACLTGFSPSKGNISLYVMPGDYLEKLGKHKASKGCLYIKKLDDIDVNVLESLVSHSVESLKKKYPDKKIEKSYQNENGAPNFVLSASLLLSTSFI